MAGVLFEDIFDVKDIDPDGKKFDRAVFYTSDSTLSCIAFETDFIRCGRTEHKNIQKLSLKSLISTSRDLKHVCIYKSFKGLGLECSIYYTQFFQDLKTDQLATLVYINLTYVGRRL
ncbi:hypothetical protein KUTeg_009123 [Tegillarca granosa]|uniref:Uncharacterized protein n=1 Tax=Tegillarca granosa TaxID=220873 RepID=A0ABQ9FAF8_TEGGR|nr:hypothetical protein KUTeg_009123 [Tegillarca granosa]